MGNYLLETKDFINYVFNYFAMKFQFAFDISREIAYAKCLLARNLGKMLNEKLQDSFSSEVVDMFFIIFVCKSPVFRDFEALPRPKYYAEKEWKGKDNIPGTKVWKKRLQLFVEIDFQALYEAELGQETLKVIAKALMSYLETMTYPVVLRKTFDRKAFEQCVRDILTEHGLL